MVNTKDDIWIEGFESNYLTFNSAILSSLGISQQDIIYRGKTSEIPEEVAIEWNTKETARESIQSACPEEWCIIYRK